MVSTVPGPLISVENVKVYPLKTFQAEGTLVFIENQRPVPFIIERVFAVSGVTPGAVRGDHAHKQCNQALVCLNGAIEIVCQDGRQSKTFQLTGPGMLLHVPAMIWASEKYETRDSVLMVLADERYDPTDYIRDWDEYLKLRGLA
jgi:dTDP-4-dehydrorhamnose 3,5-epimerase-like enzyme